MNSPRYVKPIFGAYQRITDGFVNVYLHDGSTHVCGTVWRNQQDADDWRRGSKICIYRLNIRARVQEARA